MTQLKNKRLHLVLVRGMSGFPKILNIAYIIFHVKSLDFNITHLIFMSCQVNMFKG